MNGFFLSAGKSIEFGDQEAAWCIDFKDITNLKDVVCIIVNHQRQLVFTNLAYKKVLGVEPHRVLGRTITEIEPESRCDLVLKTGKPLLLHPCNIHSLNNMRVIGNIIPWVKNNKVIGSFAAFIPVERFSPKELSIFHTQKASKVIDRASPLDSGKISLPSGKQIIGKNPLWVKVLEISTKASATDCNVLLIGESGTGKEVMAEFIHYAGLRKNGPLVQVNCAAIPEDLLESELFGYTSGAFTGASRHGKAGKFEQANGGTLFLDEIGDMSLSMQAKLLRAIEEKKVDRLGGTGSVPVDVRIIAATNQDLHQMVEEKKFRKDLFYRLHVFPIHIPPLRRRKEDIPLLIEHFASKLCSQEIPQPLYTREAYNYLINYSWPGNVRELQNVIQYALLLNDYSTISTNYLPVEPTGRELANTKLNDIDLPNTVQIKLEKPLTVMQQELEKKALTMALQTCNFNKSKASALLGITRRTLYLKMKDYHLHNQK